MVDSNKSYCLRLASITFPILHKRPPSTAASRRAPRTSEQPGAYSSSEAPPPSIEEELQELFGVEAQPPSSCLASPQGLAAALELRPDVQSRLAVITEYTPSKWLLERELEAANLWPVYPETPGKPTTLIPNRVDGTPDAYETARRRAAVGLCLSGGGIRSATFNLGILQAFSRHTRLGCFDYLASVSGGGYVHQFLANWISRTRDLQAVESLLDPIPNEPVANPVGHHATVQPEPLRWLRRYSNYLAPRKGFLSLDTWTIAAVWTRNTVLNLVIVLSVLFFLLLLPHIGTMPFVSFESHNGLLTAVRWILAVAFTFVVLILSICLSDTSMPGARPVIVKLACASLFGAAAMFSPTIYHSALPGGFINSKSARAAFAPITIQEHLHYKGSFQQQTPNSELVEVTVDANGPEVHSRLRDHWSDRPTLLIRDRFRSVPPIPVLLFSALCVMLLFSVLTSAKHEAVAAGSPAARGMDAEQLAETNKAVEKGLKLRAMRTGLFLLVGIVFLYGLLEGVRLLFFVLCFAVPRFRIPDLGVALLPTLLFAIPLLIMEYGLGMLGHDADSGQREWLARLRAFSFLFGGLWCILTTFALLGPSVVHIIGRYTVTSYTVWAGWIATTVGGVLSAQSSRTSSETDTEQSNPKTNILLELLATVAPTIFIGGLLLIISTFASWSMFVSHAQTIDPHTLLLQQEHRFFLLAGISLFIALLFGWRIDINDFSMHAFYRDRLARCYAGAVNPNRRPNLFTGFDEQDRALRVHELLPEKQLRHNDHGEVTQVGTYKGPFPIICTAINLTTGEDLAYQERKAASFVFTPLYSGYNVGWTSALSPINQFNGFVDTPTYVYARSGSLTVATACAISGAAASPSMGYHSSPSVAFLLTVFNVRLGWWLRNPRRRRIVLKTPYPIPPDAPGKRPWIVRTWKHLFPVKHGLLPSAPRFGLLKLITELLGKSNDTTSYVYLTDGGHFENMGLYELLRRRCRTIVVCDGEADSKLHFEGIGMAIRKARLDFGVEVTLDQTAPVPPLSESKHSHTAAAAGLSPKAPADPHPPASPHADAPGPQSTDPAAPSAEAKAEAQATPETNFTVSAHAESSGDVTGTITRHHPTAASAAGLGSFQPYPGNDIHCVHGTIRYPEDCGPEDFGHILYIKASITGDEPPDVLNYRRQHGAFPHDTTLNQFFTESQFESYRRLGEHIVLTDKTVMSWLDRYLGPKPSPPGKPKHSA